MGKHEIVLIGDVIKSRKKFQPKEWEQFHNSIDSINNSFGASFKIPLTIFSGDSFGAVCKNIPTTVEVILSLQQYQRPHKSKFLLIEDEISYGLETNNFAMLEGPALWESSRLMDDLKKSPSFFKAAINNSLLSITLETILNFILILKSEWNDTAWEVYERYNVASTQKEVAKELNITQQYVSKTIKQSKMEIVKKAESNLKHIIDGINSYMDNR